MDFSGIESETDRVVGAKRAKELDDFDRSQERRLGHYHSFWLVQAMLQQLREKKKRAKAAASTTNEQLFSKGLTVILRRCYLLTTKNADALQSVVTFPQHLAEFKHIHFGCRENMQDRLR
jgi:hypothetical protein